MATEGKDFMLAALELTETNAINSLAKRSYKVRIIWMLHVF